MRDAAHPGELPLRPLTTGELLDAAVVLLRTRARPLLGLAVLLALAEQVVLLWLRRRADVDISFLPDDGDANLSAFGYVIIAGLALEAFCIAVLGGAAARHAPRALLGTAAPKPPPARRGPVATAGVVAALLCGAAGWSFLVLPVPLQVLGLGLALAITAVTWVFTYGLVGLAAPAAVIDQLGPGRALLRSLTLASRRAGRAMWIRVVGYLAWAGVRLGLGWAVIAVISLVYDPPSNAADNVIMGVTWLFINAFSYAMLGCLDVALHLDVRMRTEGLDIALRRSLRRGVATDAALAVPR